MENKQKLKGGEIEMEDLNRYNSIEEIEKEGDMVKTTKKKSVTKKRKSKPKIKISGSYKRRRK